MNTYKLMKEKHQKDINEFPMFFAFSNKQFNEGMKKLCLEPSETDKIYKFGNTGGFYRKSDAPALHEMLNRHDKEMKEAIANDENFIYSMFYSELTNHEYTYTHDVSDTLDALGLSLDEIKSDKRLSSALKKACKSLEI